MADMVHGVLRGGREFSIENESWGPGRVTLRVVGSGSTKNALTAAHTWWRDYAETSNVAETWIAKRYSARPIEPEGRVIDVEIDLVPLGRELIDPTSLRYQGFDSNLQEVQSAIDLNGVDVVVAHTYPSDDKDYPGETVYQGGMVSLTLPTTIIPRNKDIYTYYPMQYVFLKGQINSKSFFGFEPGYVRLNDVKLMDSFVEPGRPPRHRIQFVFEASFWPWSDEVTFTDPRTGKPPIGLQPGVGRITPKTHLNYDFNLIIDTSDMPFWADIIVGEGGISE